MWFAKKKLEMPSREDALPGRARRMPVPDRHFVKGAPLEAPFPDGPRDRDLRPRLLLGRRAQVLAGAGRLHAPRSATPAGSTPNPTYEEVCTGMTGHNEVVLVVFDPKLVCYPRAAQGVLGEPRSDPGHAPGQRCRHAVSLGDLRRLARSSGGGRGVARRLPAGARARPASGAITTEILDAPPFYYAEDYHQQYLAKNPGGYCGLGGTGVSCPIGVGAAA